MKNILIKLILAPLVCIALSNLTYADDEKGSSDKKDTYKLEIKQVEKGTEVVATCDNGYYKKEKADEDKLKFKLPKDTDCSLHVSMSEPCEREFDIILDSEEKIYLDNYYSCDTMPTPTPTTPPTTPPIISPSMSGLENWKQPRVYAVASAEPVCNQDKVFSLRPHSTSIRTRFVDYTAIPIEPQGYTLRATQARDTTISIPLTYDATTKKWINDCSPVTYVDKKDIYPAYWVEAVNDTNGSVVTKDKIVMYDGGTDNCMACHASTSEYPLAYAKAGPANLADPEADYKTNILRKHDEEYPTVVGDYLTQLQAKGLNYNPAGLDATAQTMKVSCTDCHGINGVQGSGFKTVPSLTNAIHDLHANLSEPNIAGANNCLTCHPGETITKTFNGKIVHPFTKQWADEDGHGKWTENMGAESCTLCHGPDLRGTKISNNTSCYKCHGKEWKTPQIGMIPIPTNNGTLADMINNNNSNEEEEDD